MNTTSWSPHRPMRSLESWINSCVMRYRFHPCLFCSRGTADGIEHKMAWHQGNPLSQTLFTSLYIDKLLSASPKAVEDAHFGCPYSPAVHRGDVPASLLHIVLRTYCLALLKCCNCVHRRIEAEHCYEVRTLGLATKSALTANLFPI